MDLGLRWHANAVGTEHANVRQVKKGARGRRRKGKLKKLKGKSKSRSRSAGPVVGRAQTAATWCLQVVDAFCNWMHCHACSLI